MFLAQNVSLYNYVSNFEVMLIPVKMVCRFPVGNVLHHVATKFHAVLHATDLSDSAYASCSPRTDDMREWTY